MLQDLSIQGSREMLDKDRLFKTCHPQVVKKAHQMLSCLMKIGTSNSKLCIKDKLHYLTQLSLLLQVNQECKQELENHAKSVMGPKLMLLSFHVVTTLPVFHVLRDVNVVPYVGFHLKILSKSISNEDIQNNQFK